MPTFKRAHRGQTRLILCAMTIALVIAVNIGVGVAAKPVDLENTAAAETWPDAHTANQMLGRGVNVVVNWHFYGRPGENIEAADGAAVAQAGGFDSVRLFVDFGNAAGPAPKYHLDPAFVAELRAAIAEFTNRGIAVSINFDGSIVSVERFGALWRRIAADLADLPPTIFFELANEPLWHHVPGQLPDFSAANVVTPSQWNELVAAAIPAIRETNPNRIIVVTSGSISFPQALPELVLPPGDDHLIATFHQYQPLNVTHPLTGTQVPWSGTPAEIAALKATMNDAVCWARANGIPLYVSEFGIANTADQLTRRAWLNAVARLIEAEGMSWAYFELSSDGFGVWDRHAQQWRADLYEALFPPTAPTGGAWASCAAPASPNSAAPAPNGSLIVASPEFTG